MAQARDGHAATQQQLASTQKREQELLVRLKAADKRADDNAGAHKCKSSCVYANISASLRVSTRWILTLERVCVRRMPTGVHTCVYVRACVRACVWAPVYVDAASAAESESTSKIAEVNEKCARFYQDREDARDMLADCKAAVSSYKRALLAVKYALKTPVVSP